MTVSEVKRYKVDSIRLGNPTTARTHLMVHAELFDAAQSELTALKAELASEEQDHAELRDVVAALREELATAKRAGPPHFCGLPMSLNPHPEAGLPGRFLEVGAVIECIPCLVSSRHGWAKTASDLQQRLTATEQRNADVEKRAADLIECLWGIELPGAGNPRLRKLRRALEALKPTESGASE